MPLGKHGDTLMFTKPDYHPGHITEPAVTFNLCVIIDWTWHIKSGQHGCLRAWLNVELCHDLTADQLVSKSFDVARLTKPDVYSLWLFDSWAVVVAFKTSDSYYNPNNSQGLVPGAKQILHQFGVHAPACGRKGFSHQPVKGRRSQPHPRLSHFHLHWCSPRPSFWWRRSSLLCLWTGSLSRKWTPTCKRHRQHHVRSISTSHHTPPQPTIQPHRHEHVQWRHWHSALQCLICSVPYRDTLKWLWLCNLMVVIRFTTTKTNQTYGIWKFRRSSKLLHVCKESKRGSSRRRITVVVLIDMQYCHWVMIKQSQLLA